MALGPGHLNREQKLLYACVALSCVTETLSTALLVEMQERAAPGMIKATVHEILTDEINHSRIGWAELSRHTRSRDLSWISALLPGMLGEAMQTDVQPMLSADEGELDLSEWGILTPKHAQKIVKEAIQVVIIPGLEQNGIDPSPIQ